MIFVCIYEFYVPIYKIYSLWKSLESSHISLYKIHMKISYVQINLYKLSLIYNENYSGKCLIFLNLHYNVLFKTDSQQLQIPYISSEKVHKINSFTI